MRKYEVWGGSKGGQIKIYDHGLRASLLRHVEASLDFVDGVILRHALCGSGLPELAWRVPIGRPVRDEEDGMLNNSVGALMYDTYSRVTDWLYQQCEKDLVATIPISDAQLSVLAPSLSAFEE